MPSRLDALVKARFELSWSRAREWISTGKVFVAGVPHTDPGELLTEETELELRMNAPRVQNKPAAPRLEQSAIVHLDSQCVVVNKPSGLNSVPFDRAERNSLEQQTSARLGTRKLHVVHRLDRDTSGLLVFARTEEAAHSLAQQFRFHRVHRRYLALATGEPEEGTIRTFLLENRGDGLRGSVRGTARVSQAKEAITHVEVKERFGDFSLLECRLETGRTHQIRIHLSESGHPLVGEDLYVREKPSLPAARIMLHAAELGFTHPQHGTPVSWTVAPPEDFLSLLSKGRSHRRR